MIIAIHKLSDCEKNVPLAIDAHTMFFDSRNMDEIMVRGSNSFLPGVPLYKVVEFTNGKLSEVIVVAYDVKNHQLPLSECIPLYRKIYNDDIYLFTAGINYVREMTGATPLVSNRQLFLVDCLNAAKSYQHMPGTTQLTSIIEDNWREISNLVPLCTADTFIDGDSWLDDHYMAEKFEEYCPFYEDGFYLQGPNMDSMFKSIIHGRYPKRYPSEVKRAILPKVTMPEDLLKGTSSFNCHDYDIVGLLDEIAICQANVLLIEYSNKQPTLNGFNVYTHERMDQMTYNMHSNLVRFGHSVPDDVITIYKNHYEMGIIELISKGGNTKKIYFNIPHYLMNHRAFVEI